MNGVRDDKAEGSGDPGLGPDFGGPGRVQVRLRPGTGAGRDRGGSCRYDACSRRSVQGVPHRHAGPEQQRFGMVPERDGQAQSQGRRDHHHRRGDGGARGGGGRAT